MSNPRKGKSNPRLEPPPRGLGDFWSTVRVTLFTPIQDVDSPEGNPLVGYYRHFGVRAAPERVHLVLGGAVTDGTILWDDTEWSLVDPESLDTKILARVEPVAGEGIWYRSGRALYER